jgi:mRNA interferase MazF
MGWLMLRGEIRLIDLEPTRGAEANRRRPAVIVSNDRANGSATRLARGVVTIVPVTSNVARVYPFQTLLPADATGLRVDSKAQAEQVRSVTIERVGPIVGRVPPVVMADLDAALRLHLATLVVRRPWSCGDLGQQQLLSHRSGCGDEGNRTPNPRLAKAVLCQLSYVPGSNTELLVGGLVPDCRALLGAALADDDHRGSGRRGEYQQLHPRSLRRSGAVAMTPTGWRSHLCSSAARAQQAPSARKTARALSSLASVACGPRWT